MKRQRPAVDEGNLRQRTARLNRAAVGTRGQSRRDHDGIVASGCRERLFADARSQIKRSNSGVIDWYSSACTIGTRNGSRYSFDRDRASLAGDDQEVTTAVSAGLQ